MKKKFITLFICLLFIMISFYLMVPAINMTDPGFWSYLFFVTIVCTIISFAINTTESIIIKKKNNYVPSKNIIMVVLPIFIIPIIISIVNFFYSPLLNADVYYERIKVTDGDFAKDIEAVDFDNLALLDRKSSIKLGDKVMGQMPDLVSQYEVSSQYTQISSNETILRVTPLEYASAIKYFTNRKKGVEAYITVNSVNGESSLVRLDKGMKYMPSAIFSEDLYRQLRFSYPTSIFGDINFEIDDEGNPYWIAEVISYKGVGLLKEISDVIVLNPIDGTSKKYDIEKCPTWIDHGYDSDLVMEQLDDWGMYKNGFFNSIFGQKEVIQTTNGYNYLKLNNDIYMYTGITSVANDASNIGFVLTNLRTKETHFYNVAGAEETSAMESAKGQVQQMNYSSTFPLLINLNNKPTYLVSLKDNAGLVKMYAFIDYTDYQKVVVTDASKGIEAAAEEYIGGEVTPANTKDETIKVDYFTTGVINGNTYYYIESNEVLYKASLKGNENVLPFIKVGDKLEITYKEGNINTITKIKN